MSLDAKRENIAMESEYMIYVLAQNESVFESFSEKLTLSLFS